MIDYDKLKIAREMAYNSSYFFDISMGKDCDNNIDLYNCDSSISFVCNCDGLDDLIRRTLRTI